MATIPTSLVELFAGLIERALAGALALDPATRERLRALAGRRLCLRLDPPGLTLHLQAEESGAVRVLAAAGEAELSLAARPAAVLARLMGAPPPSGSLQIAGDVELARALERLLAAYEPDLDPPFVALFGDLLGPQLARLARGLLAALARQARAFGEDLREWIRDEEGVAVSAAEGRALQDEVEALRDAVERLEKRVERLAKALADAEQADQDR